MRVIITEKPSVAMDIARVLGRPQKHDGYVTVGEDAVTWAYGHLATLAAPEQYQPAWKRWSWETLPMIPDAFQVVPIAKTRSQLAVLQRLLKSADRVVAATDADREGELIIRYILDLSGVDKPVSRLWLSENTPEAIRRALSQLKPLSAYDHLAVAARARAEADWLVGLNATRAFSLRHGRPGTPLSVGRVQTPTLRLIYDRDREVEAFTPTPYWQVAATFEAPEGTYVGLWQGAHTEHPDRISTEEEARRVLESVVPGTAGTIASLTTKRVTLKPPLLYSLNDLQKEANRRYGMTAQDILNAAQRLYDQHLLSYPRTDSRHLTAELAFSVGERLAGLRQQDPYQSLVSGVPTPLRTARLINEAEVSKAGHHGLIPTGKSPGGRLSPKDVKIYDLVVRRFLASLYPAGVDDRTTLMTQVESQSFKTTGTVEVVQGWRQVLKPSPEREDEEVEKSAIPSGLLPGETVVVVEAESRAKETKAPPKLTDASLLALMEKHGLGTPATRARIVEVLLDRDYVVRRKKLIETTNKGRQLLEVVPDTIQSPKLTGGWEQILEDVAMGSGNPVEFMQAIRVYTKELVDAARAQQGSTMSENDLGPCPLCQRGRVISNAKGWSCSRWREGCPFMIWRTVAGKKLSEAQVKTLVAGKMTAELKGFKSKAGKPFQAKLRFNAESGRVEFIFRTASRSKKAAGP